MNKTPLHTTAKFGFVAAFALLAGTVMAQGNYVDNQRAYLNNAAVTVYEDCDFRGKGSVVNIGEYRSLSKLRFPNDKMSSIKVPSGLSVTIYEDDNYGGAYTTIDRDVSCFDRQWNDTVSSLRVVSSANQGVRDDRRANRPNPGPRVGSDFRNRGNSQLDANVTGKNVSQVAFGSSVLQQTGRALWQLNNPRSGIAQFEETSRDNNSVYLQNQYTAQRIRIDTFANDVTFIDRNGGQQRYTIDRKQAAQASARRDNQAAPRTAPSTSSPNRRISGECFTFKAYTTGGNGGLRFQGKKEYYRFDRKAESGRVCHNGSLTMEINKTDNASDVIVEIDGNRYRFAPNEKADEFKNSWYRKYVRLVVGR